MAELRAAYDRDKRHALLGVAEGARHDAAALSSTSRSKGSAWASNRGRPFLDTCSAAPTAFDRLLAGRSGADAVKRLAAGAAGLLVGLVGTRIRATPLAEAVASTKTLAPGLIRLARVLAA